MQVDELKQRVLAALDDLKGRDVVVLDVRASSSVTDYMVIASGTSSRQVVALARHLMDEMKQQDVAVLGVEGVDAGEWVLVDLGDLVVHIMQPQTREFYDLEKLWGEFASPMSHQA
ncbi:ribosome silencing factor [Marinospirillum alkaliphilum]|uniref:Ribosomal silencing factor RsfS n=1 Tax=Marinospirillum alkaliphilum DSM 21637 TaxID=1122209 RepID=A0A1K1YLG0_9GAMM|nr:ribosome silencing factor [Marinospirillum alkaliphilum]SFX62817.1 ribosome-associated protein [Marinospirillum alkaliphilum DSM 21637]